MKRAFFFLVSFILLSLALRAPVCAAESATDSLLLPLINAPSFITEHLPEDITDPEALGAAVGPERLLSLLISGVTQAFEKEKGALLRLLGTALLFSVGTLLCRGRETAGMLNGVAALAVYRLFEESVARVTDLLSELATFSGIVAPIYTGVLAAGGNATAATSGSIGFSAFLSVLETLGGGVLAPLLRTMLALTLVSGFSSLPAVGEISRSLRNTYLFLLSLLCALLGASLAFQTALASSADSVAVRTVKFAVGNAIPVVGGSVSAALGSLATSLSLVRHTVGTASAVVLLSLVLPTVSELLLLRLALSLCEGLTNALGATGIGGVFGRFRGLYDLMLATVAILSVLFLLLSGVLASISPAISGV